MPTAHKIAVYLRPFKECTCFRVRAHVVYDDGTSSYRSSRGKSYEEALLILNEVGVPPVQVPKKEIVCRAGGAAFLSAAPTLDQLENQGVLEPDWLDRVTSVFNYCRSRLAKGEKYAAPSFLQN